MELYFFRHGIAADKNDPSIPSDRDRPLTEEGIKKTHAAAEGLARMALPIDKILTSPWLRALQTAKILGEVFGMNDRVEELDELSGDRTVEELLAGLTTHRNVERLVLVGHQPLLEEAIAFLLSGEKAMQVDLKKSGVCAVETSRLAPASATLLWLLTSKQLRMLR